MACQMPFSGENKNKKTVICLLSAGFAYVKLKFYTTFLEKGKVVKILIRLKFC